jgi:predicted nucleotidyltransferase
MLDNLSVAGIVAEYNPFHYGHLHHINETRKICGAVVAVMSGNFVQRCEPAICDKYARAKSAVAGGVDLVIGLPARYALGSAEKFAFGAVSVLDALGFIDILSFGSESGDLNSIVSTSEKIDRITPQEYKNAMADGKSFAQARSEIIGAEQCGPNDVLGIEYIRALKKLDSSIRPLCVRRTDGYLESASTVREKIMKGDLSSLPDFSAEILKEEIRSGRAPADQRNIERLLLGFIRNAEESDTYGIYGINREEGTDRRILSAAKASSAEELYSLIKTKRQTNSAVKRAVISAYLRIKNEPLTPVPFIHILAFSETGRRMLKAVPDNIPVISNMSKIKDIYPDYADEERRTTDLFFLSTPKIGPGYSEFTRKFT